MLQCVVVKTGEFSGAELIVIVIESVILDLGKQGIANKRNGDAASSLNSGGIAASAATSTSPRSTEQTSTLVPLMSGGPPGGFGGNAVPRTRCVSNPCLEGVRQANFGRGEPLTHKKKIPLFHGSVSAQA